VDAKGREHGSRDLLRFRDQCQVDEEDTFATPVEQLGGDLQGEAGLSRTAGTGQGDEPRRLNERARLGDLGLSPDEDAQVSGKVVR